MEGELLRWLPWVRGGLREACPKFAVSGRPTCADPGLPTSLSPHPQQAVGGPGAFCWVLCFVAFFFFSLFIVADALHQETELGAPRREMVPIYIGFQEIDPFFFPCALEQLGIAGASGAQPPSPARGCSQRCVSKLVKDTMPVPPMVLGSPEPASPP